MKKSTQKVIETLGWILTMLILPILGLILWIFQELPSLHQSWPGPSSQESVRDAGRPQSKSSLALNSAMAFLGDLLR